MEEGGRERRGIIDWGRRRGRRRMKDGGMNREGRGEEQGGGKK